MGSEAFNLITVARVFVGEIELAEALGFPEISALGETERQWQTVLQAKSKALLEDSNLSPALSLHRRRLIVQPELSEIEISLHPPTRSPAWQEPVSLRLPIVRWVESSDLYQAYVPALRALIFAPREDLLEQRIKAHVRLLLMGRRKKLGLGDLAELTRSQFLKLGNLPLTARIPTPKEISAGQGGEHDKHSMLETLAEELPPQVASLQAKNAISKAAQEGSSYPALAWEVESELEKLSEALGSSHGRSILLIGPSGCGKTALVRELARRRRDFALAHTPFWTTSGARLMTGPIGFGMWQDRCQKLCQETAKTGAILHLGNLAELLEVGKASRGQQSVGSFLRPWIARGEILCIAECTPEQIGLIERNDPHLLASFLQIQVPERTPAQTRKILGLLFETAPGKAPSDSLLAESTKALDRLHQLHSRYALYSANPGRPIRFLKNLLADHFPNKALTEAEVTAAFSRETGLPSVLLDDRIPLDLDKTKDWFSGRLMGQPEAIAQVIDLLAVIKARLARPRKPLASLLFIGPTGTGKTELAKALAEFLFGDVARMARFDLNQFNDPAALQRLIGGPLAGSAEGLLTARVREQPFSVLLLDEFEKADPAFFDLLLQILGDGRLTDGQGRVADFCNCVIVMTSNLGAQGFQRGPSGFRADAAATPEAREHFTEEARKFLRPEIFNRIDAVLPFQPLTPEVVLNIARRQIELLKQRDGFRLRSMDLAVHPGVAEHLAQKGYDIRYGARPLKRAIERELLAPLAEAVGRYAENVAITAQVGIEKARIRIEVRAVHVPGASQGADRAAAVRSQLSEAIASQRRLIARLNRCSATSQLENQITIAESLARRLAKSKWKSLEQQKRLARLPGMKDCLAGIETLHQRARNLATEALSEFYQGTDLETTAFVARLEELKSERHRLSRELFRLRFEKPDEILLAIYSENRSALLELGMAYFTAGKDLGQAVAVDFLLPPAAGRSRASRAVRQTPKKPQQPFESVPEKVVGLVMDLRGDLFYPRFEQEAGLHIIKEKKTETLCLVETRNMLFADYQPPEGIERQGGIKAKDAPFCRSYDREAAEVEDSKSGTLPWRLTSIAQLLQTLTEQRLHNSIETVTEL